MSNAGIFNIECTKGFSEFRGPPKCFQDPQQISQTNDTPL